MLMIHLKKHNCYYNYVSSVQIQITHLKVELEKTIPLIQIASDKLRWYCYRADEHKTTKKEKDKLDKFKHSSKTTSLHRLLVICVQLSK